MPQVKGAPKHMNEIMEATYATCMKKYGDETRCAKIAFGAAKNAGYRQDSKGNWKKTKRI